MADETVVDAPEQAATERQTGGFLLIVTLGFLVVAAIAYALGWFSPGVLQRTEDLLTFLAALAGLGLGTIIVGRVRKVPRRVVVIAISVVVLVAASGLALRMPARSSANGPGPVPPSPSTPAPGPTSPAPSPTADPTDTTNTNDGPDPLPTKTPTPTQPHPAPVPNPYRPSQDHVLVDDTIGAGSRHWSNLDSGTGTCALTGSGLHAASNDSSKYHECYNSTSVGDATIEISFSFGSARAAGLFFRQSGDGKWYFVEIGRSGSIWLDKGDAGDDTDLATGTTSAPDPSAAHRLAVTAEGTRLTVYLDGRDVLSASDGSYHRGPIGVFTDGGKAPDGTESAAGIVVHRLRIWTG